MAVSPISAGVVGCGRMGAFTSEGVRLHAPACWFPLAHAEAIASHPRLSLTGVVDADSSQAQRAAAAHGTRAFGTLSEMLESARPRLVGIATRTIGRADIIHEAAASGTRAMHVEKPLCNSVSELDALDALLSAGDIALTLGAIRRHMAPYRAAMTHAASGALGAFQDIQVNLGTAPLCWTHPHSIDLILAAAAGRSVDVVSARFTALETGSSATTVENDPILEWAVIRFEDGLTGRIGRVPGSDLILSGSDAALAVEADGHRIRHLHMAAGAAYPEWRDWADWKAHVPAREAAPQGTLAAMDQLVRCLDQEPEALAANRLLRQDILTGQRILFAMLQSHAEGSRPIRLADVDGAWNILAISNGRHA